MKIYINRFNLFFIITYFIWTLYLYLIYFASNYIKGGNFRNGFKLGNDSPRYIDAAKDILQFNIPEGKALSYLSYDLFVAIALLFRDNLLDVVYNIYYKDWSQRIIIDRGPVTTIPNFT